MNGMLDEGTLAARLPRCPLATLPTPIEDAPRLSAALDGPRILIKRDDLTGLAFGGNKVRKLEWLLGDALAKGADCLVTLGAGQSNHCRQTAAAAVRAGLACYLLLYPPFHGEGQANLLLDELLGAHITRLGGREPEVQQRGTDDLLARLRSDGRRPYLIPVGGSNGVGSVGYVLCALELRRQLTERGLEPTHVYFSSGSAGTHAGLLVGRDVAGAAWRLVGISPGHPAAYLTPRVAEVAAETAALLHLPDAHRAYAAADVQLDDSYVGPRYGTLTPECVEAVRLVARTEGLLLDPVYTGKAMAGLIAHIRRGRITSHDTVVFIHTGGTPGLFAYHEELSSGAA
jgi:D-cysteine desulfhydrase family pyridoxal phosphate-dependent enzyme